MIAAKEITYTHPPGVQGTSAAGRPALTTPQGGKIIVDRPTLSLWRAAAGNSLPAVLGWAAAHGQDSLEAACMLACLCRAGLLCSEALPPAPQAAALESSPPPEAALVSVVIVSYNSRAWLPGCLDTLYAQTYPALEVIVVDNGSSDDSVAWLLASQSGVRVLPRPQGGSLAAALNDGIRGARGALLLLLNPDVELEPDAVAQMVRLARSGERCAAVAAKLRFLWAPAFLNGMGNLVGAFSYGSDIALGHLDLGQFDHWDSLPSACFAAALIPREALDAVGPVDEGFPMYYEDTEWCYRARLLGWQVRAAPTAVVYHAFSGRTPTGEQRGLAETKLRRVVYGRQRFIARLLGSDWLARFRRRYSFEDLLGRLRAAARRHPQLTQAYRLAQADYRAAQPALQSERATLQARRLCSDAQLFSLQRNAPPALIWNGLPLLTRDVILQHYAPWLLGPDLERFPEVQAVLQTEGQDPRHMKRSAFRRALDIRRDEGMAALVHRLARAIQWRLMRP